ncbi:MAG: DUF805 domain-containing protein [Candidatus Thiodiazotropha endolucinida]
MEKWQILNPEGRLKRRPFFYRVVVVVFLAVVGGYLLREALTTKEGISPYYLEITFSWSIIILGLLTPFAVQRCRDIGIAVWWVLLLWLSPFSDLRFILIVSEYTGTDISGRMLWPATFTALIVIVFIVMLFFSRSSNNANNIYQP